jgi:hypothetical protein
MILDFTKLMLGQKLLLSYLLVGYATQCPAVYLGYFLYIDRFRHLKKSSFFVKSLAGLYWLCFTSILWPIPFLRAGLNWFAIELILVGIIGAILILAFATTFIKFILILFGITILCIVIARIRGIKG